MTRQKNNYTLRSICFWMPEPLKQRLEEYSKREHRDRTSAMLHLISTGLDEIERKGVVEGAELTRQRAPTTNPNDADTTTDAVTPTPAQGAHNHTETGGFCEKPGGLSSD